MCQGPLAETDLRQTLETLHRTLRIDRLSLTCLHIEQQLGDSLSQEVLAGMKQRLQALPLSCQPCRLLPRASLPRRSHHRRP